MKEPSVLKQLKKIFPNADRDSEENYLYYLRVNKGNTKEALYSFGLFTYEFPKYKKEINDLEKSSKKWYLWYTKDKNKKFRLN